MATTKTKASKHSKRVDYSKPWQAKQRREASTASGKRLPESEKNEMNEVFCSIDWAAAWEMFLKRVENGTFKYVTAKQLAEELVIGIDDVTKKRRVGYVLKAIGKEIDERSPIPYIGDWELIRSNQFLGEFKKESLLFGNPSMKVFRQAMREHVNLMKVAQELAEQLFMAIARYQMWQQELDEHYQYKLIDPNLSKKDQQTRMTDYMTLQNNINDWMATAVERVMGCFGMSKNNMQVLQQIIVKSHSSELGEDITRAIIAGISGVELTAPLTNPELNPDVLKQPSDGDGTFTDTMKLLIGSFADKAKIYKMNHPGLKIPGVPDEDIQELSREDDVKRRLGHLLPPEVKPEGRRHQ